MMDVGEFNLIPNEKFWIRESRIPISENFESLTKSAEYLSIITTALALHFNGKGSSMPIQYLSERFLDETAKFFIYLSVTCEKLNVTKSDLTFDITNSLDHTIQSILDAYFKYAEEHDKEHPLPENPLYPEIEHLSCDLS